MANNNTRQQGTNNRYNNGSNFQINGSRQEVRHRPVVFQKICTRYMIIEGEEVRLWFPTLEFYDDKGRLLELTEKQLQASTVYKWIFDENNEAYDTITNPREIQKVDQFIYSSLQWLSHNFATNVVVMVDSIEPQIKEIPVPVPSVNWKLTFQVLGAMALSAFLSVVCISPLLMTVFAR